MLITTQIELLDQLLAEYATDLGRDFLAYKNHCYRVYHFCSALIESHAFQHEKLCIALAFHDLAIWTHHTFDYLEPSLKMAQDYATKVGWPEWCMEVGLMITEHHKFTPVKDKPLIEAFRKADWIDVCMGLVKFNMDAHYIQDVQRAFPDEGFHLRLVQLAGKRMLFHPLSPLPMMKW